MYASRDEIRASHWFTSAHGAQSTCSKKKHASRLSVIILSAFSFIVAWTSPVANLQPGPRRSKAKNSARNLVTRTHVVRFLYCNFEEYVTLCKVDSTGMIALNSFSSALMKAESLPSYLECTAIRWIVSGHLL